MTKIPVRSCALWVAISCAAAFQVCAATPTCDDLPSTTVDVVLLESPIQTDFQRSYRSLKGMSNRYADYGFSVLGLTTGEATVSAKVAIRTLRVGNGGYECATSRITLALGYQPLKVFVGREFPQGSCSFKEIYAHELRHAEIYRAQGKLSAQEMIAAMKSRFQDSVPMRGPVGSSQAKIEAEINERWLPYAQRLLNRAEALQREVDTREEYERVSTSCQGEIGRLMGRSR